MIYFSNQIRWDNSLWLQKNKPKYEKYKPNYEKC